MTVIVAYAPTDISDEETKDAYYKQLLSTAESAPPHDLVIVLTDAYAMLSLETRDPYLRPVVGPVLIDAATNNNGHRLIDLCRSENL